jgi:hypothetical protein
MARVQVLCLRSAGETAAVPCATNARCDAIFARRCVEALGARDAHVAGVRHAEVTAHSGALCLGGTESRSERGAQAAERMAVRTMRRAARRLQRKRINVAFGRMMTCGSR